MPICRLADLMTLGLVAAEQDAGVPQCRSGCLSRGHGWSQRSGIGLQGAQRKDQTQQAVLCRVLACRAHNTGTPVQYEVLCRVYAKPNGRVAMPCERICWSCEPMQRPTLKAAKHCAALHLTGGLGGSQSPCLGMVPPLWSSKVTCLAETGRHEEAWLLWQQRPLTVWADVGLRGALGVATLWPVGLWQAGNGQRVPCSQVPDSQLVGGAPALPHQQPAGRNRMGSQAAGPPGGPQVSSEFPSA